MTGLLQNYKNFLIKIRTNTMQQIPNIKIRLGRKQFIKQLQALQDSYIELLLNSNNLNTITLKDRNNLNRMTTKN